MNRNDGAALRRLTAGVAAGLIVLIAGCEQAPAPADNTDGAGASAANASSARPTANAQPADTAPKSAALEGDLTRRKRDELPEPVAHAVTKAKTTVANFGNEILGLMMREITSGGPAAAIKVCSSKAQEVAQSHCTDTVSVRRVTLKVRNPADAPDDFERAKLAQMASAAGNGEKAAPVIELVEQDGGQVVRLMQPIFVSSICLNCHGPKDKLLPEVRETLAENYPIDNATGYADGDLRGAFSAIVQVKSEGS